MTSRWDSLLTLQRIRVRARHLQELTSRGVVQQRAYGLCWLVAALAAATLGPPGVAAQDLFLESRGRSSLPPSSPPIDPDAGIVINWTALDTIAASFATAPAEQWLPAPSPRCLCEHLRYRPLYCPWYLKPFRDPFDLVVTETTKWPVSRKLLGCEADAGMLNGFNHTGLPMISYFATECCGIFSNATQGFKALSTFDTCWFDRDELQRCFAQGSAVPRWRTQLSKQQYQALLRNASYADLATPHL